MTQRKSGVASRELAAERRRRRHRQVIRNRIIFGLACLAILFLIIFGIVKLISGIAGSRYDEADASILKFNNDGTITYEELADFDEEMYSKKEFKEYTKQLIGSFNETMGAESISLDKFKVKDGKAYVRTTYESSDVYSSFTSYQVFIGPVDEAREAGYDFESIICSVVGEIKSEAIEFDSPSFFSGYNVAVVKENTRVSIPGTINYISKYSTQVIDDHTVSIMPDDGNVDATDYVYIIFTEDEQK